MMWTAQEITEYRPPRYKPLVRLYLEVNITEAHPERREAYLSQVVLKLDEEDREALREIEKDEGKVKKLQALEQLVLAAHREATKHNRNLRDKIRFPLTLPEEYKMMNSESGFPLE